ncbi:MAG TPA: hypothetical protein VGL37_04200 [Solirubrobacteraceae bacterium]|jgi:hypothetical protein
MTDTFASESSNPGGISSEMAQQGGDVTGTLADLERKLRELERELSSIGRRRALDDAAPGTQAAAPSPQPATPPQQATPPLSPPAPAAPRPTGAGASGAGASSPAQPPAATAAPRLSGRLVDEAIEPQDASTGERTRPSEAQLASLAELRRFRDRLERFAKELATEYDELLGRVMTGLTSAPADPAPADPAPAPAAPATPSPSATPASPPSATPTPSPAQLVTVPPPAATAEESRENALFEGRVELGVGPFYDIASLGAFERQLAALAGVSEATVRRFEASHAVVDVRLAAPVALVRELRRVVESDFSVREVASGRILLTFDES